MPTLHKPNNSSPVRWVPPQNGLYKVNIDGAVFWNFHLLNSYISCISFAKLKLSTLKGKATNQDMVVCTVCWWCNSYFSNMKWNKFRWGFLKKKKKKEFGERPRPNNIWFCADRVAAYGIHSEMIYSTGWAWAW